MIRRRESDRGAHLDTDAVLRVIAEVCVRAAAGDLEARLPVLGSSDRAVAARTAVNGLLDMTDAFVRESGAALAAAAEGRYHRRFLTRGMKGAFHQAATTIGSANTSMKASAEAITAAERSRLALADQLEATVVGVSEQVATASSRVSATARDLSDFVNNAVSEAERGMGTVTSLRTAAEQIRAAVDLITRVAAQTRLLSLNATIEAARAGEAGRGFSVVASEVKDLANETAKSSVDILEQVNTVQRSSASAVAVLEAVTASIREMNNLLAGISDAVDGGHDGSSHDTTGLSELASLLRSEVDRFVTNIRHPG